MDSNTKNNSVSPSKELTTNFTTDKKIINSFLPNGPQPGTTHNTPEEPSTNNDEETSFQFVVTFLILYIFGLLVTMGFVYYLIQPDPITPNQTTSQYDFDAESCQFPHDTFRTCVPTKMGYVVNGINIRNLNSTDTERIQQAVLKYGVIVLRNTAPNTSDHHHDSPTTTTPYSPQDLYEFLRAFGDPIKLPPQLAYDNQVEDLEYIVRISNIRKDGTFIENNKAAEYWHQDGNFRTGKQLYVWNFLLGDIIPATGGATGFIDARRPLGILPDWLHTFLADHSHIIFPSKIPDFQALANKMNFDDVENQCILQHALTHEDTLYLGKLSQVHFRDLPPFMAESLLQYLVQCYLATDANTYLHAWQPNDLVIWDNTLVYHRSMGGYGNQPRRLYRGQVFLNV